jgi:gliding motility-associated-like protein
MISYRLLIAAFISQVIAFNLSAQVITNGDGSPLTKKYCWENSDHAIAGQPAGGTFSGCGISQVNGQWYFNAIAASNGVTIFPYSCMLSYTVNGNTLSVPILVWKPVVVTPPLRDTTTCDGNFYLEAEMLYAGDYDYAWTPAANLNTPTSAQTTGYIDQTTTFIVTARDLTSDCLGSDTVIVTRLAQPQITVCNDTTLLARASVRLFASGADSYEWSPRQWLDTFTSATPLATPHAPVTYTVKGTSASGCVATADVHIDIIEHILIPNAFSPNGDGINDEFRIANYGYQALQEFRIFNRWGEQIFTTTDGSKGWDGTQRGQPADAGTYPYYIRLQLRDGIEQVFKGDITLLR